MQANNRFLNPAIDEDFVNILLHDTPVILEKIASDQNNGSIRLGEKRTGKIKELKIGAKILLDGKPNTSTSELEMINIEDKIPSIALKTRNSVYSIYMADESNISRKQSLKFLRTGCLDFNEKMTDGFYDAGRNTAYYIEENKLRIFSPREIIGLSEERDPALKILINSAKSLLGRVKDLETRIKMLSIFVSNSMGGSTRVEYPEHDLILLSGHEVRNITKDKPQQNIVPIGYLNHGVCRHRALLFKYLADRFEIPSRLVRGDYRSSGHQWNVVQINGEDFIVDTMQRKNPTEMYAVGSEEAKNYKRLGLVAWK